MGDSWGGFVLSKDATNEPFSEKISLLQFFLTYIGRARFVDWPN